MLPICEFMGESWPLLKERLAKAKRKTISFVITGPTTAERERVGIRKPTLV